MCQRSNRASFVDPDFTVIGGLSLIVAAVSGWLLSRYAGLEILAAFASGAGAGLCSMVALTWLAFRREHGGRRAEEEPRDSA
jgi:hypothetical protein